LPRILHAGGVQDVQLHCHGLADIREGPIAMILFIALLHIVGWGTLIAIVGPQHLAAGTTAFGFGIGLTAYTLGVRHAFDADHIAAIDNTTRKLMHEGKRPRSVGFWFSFGHSSVVFALTLLLVVGVGAVAGPVRDGNSQLHIITGLIGTVVSSGFLYAIAALNIVVLVDIWKLFRRMRTGQCDEDALEKQLARRGLISRLLGRVMNFVTEPWQMYAVGLLFGLGFDTATEIALLVLTSSGAASGLPWYAVLCLPILFAAGMSLFDTIDGSFMTAAYGWAIARPARKVYYNLVVTGLSVAVALMIGTVEIIGLLGERLSLHGPVWSWVAALDLNRIGFVIVGLFVATWVFAVAVWKFGGLEEQWSAAFRRVAAEGE
jgi:nickel/cobalt transporter (NiCoT) family protein